MFTPRTLYASCFLILCLLSAAFAQGEQPSKPGIISQSSSTVTASAVAGRVRFTAPSNVVRMQLQIISESGQILFDVSSKGNVLDWSLQDSSGQRLQGSYLTVVTVKSLSGRLSERFGSVSIGEKQVELQRVETTQLAAAQQQAVGPIEENAALTILKADEAEAVTVLSNNGGEGQIIRDRGALSFRMGDFFSGTDKEQMRLTEEGNLGIGTSAPESKLDVAGTIRARQGFVFNDGSTLKVNDKGALSRTDSNGNITPNIAGTGTQDKLAKWTDNSGTLGDSVIAESSGNIGIGTASPANKLDVVRGAGGLMAKSFYEMSSFEYNADAKFGVYSSASSAPSAALTFGSTVLQANSKFPGFELQYIYSPTPAQNQARFNYIERGANGAVVNFAANLLTINGNGNVTLNPVTSGVTSSPRLGIGVASPLAPLDVAGNINTSTQYNIGGDRVLSVPGATGNNTFVGVFAGNSNTSGIRNSFFGRSAGFFNSDGESNAFFGFQAGNLNSVGGGNAFFGFQAGNVNIDGGNNTAIGSAANFGSGGLFNATAIGSQAQVDARDSLVLGSINGVNGALDNTKVGIGVTAPLATLHVVSFSNTAADNTATFEAPTIGSNKSHIHWGTTGDWYIRSAVGAGKVVLQDTGGNVGIGTASPVAKLDVRDGTGASGSGGHLQIGAPVSSADEKIITFGDACSGVPCVYIGEQGADDRMVLGGREFRFANGGNVLPDSDNIQSIGSSTNRWKDVWAVNGTIQTSDIRLKRGITNLKYGLSQVMQLRPVSFRWKSGNDNATHLGLIAQEVDAVMPEAVEKSADADAPLGMNYSNLIPVLIKAIQEQQGTLERAQAEIKTLRTENAALSRRINSIEAKSTVATSTKKAQ